MRIWILNHYATPRGRAGSNTHSVLAHLLQQRGHEMTIFPASVRSGKYSECKIPSGVIFSDYYDEGVRYRYIRTKLYQNATGRFLNMLSYRKYVCRSVDDLNRPDVIIGSCVHPWAVDAAVRLAIRYCTAFVYQIRDIWPQTLVDMGELSHWHPLYWYMRRLELRAFQHSDGVISVLPGIYQYAKEHGIARDKICYLPNGIDPTLYPKTVQSRKKGPFLISYFGAHGTANDLATIIDAAAIIQRKYGSDAIRFRLVGDGTNKPMLMKKKDILGLRNVEFLERVPKSELASLAQETDAFVFLLRRLPVIEKYGMSPNKLCDYLMCGRPIVFACRSLNNPVAEAGAGISIEPQNPDALARAVIYLKDLPTDVREHMGVSARTYALTHHDLSKLVVQLETFLSEITSTNCLASVHRPQRMP